LNSFEGYANGPQMAWRVSPDWWCSTIFACLHVIRVHSDIKELLAEGTELKSGDEGSMRMPISKYRSSL